MDQDSVSGTGFTLSDSTWGFNMKTITGFILALAAVTSLAQPTGDDYLKLEKMTDNSLNKNRISYIHAMRGDETVELARKRINAWIRYNFESAFANKAKGDMEKALLDYFTARHTLRDATSPVANDEQGNPAVFRGDLPDDNRQLSNTSWRNRVDEDTWLMFENNYVPAGDLLRMYGIDSEKGPVDRPNQLPRPTFARGDRPSTNVQADAMQISMQGENYEISVPVSKLRVTIPKGTLLQRSSSSGESSKTTRYFYFEDKPNKRAISGWMEPAQKFKGIHEFWESEKKDWTKRTGLQEPQNVTFEKIDKWEAVVYEIPTPMPNATLLNIRAHWVEAGTWIDLHISVVSNKSVSESRDGLFGFLKSIQVRQKE